MVWADLDSPSDEEFELLARIFEWHPLAIEDCLVQNLLPKIDDFGDYLLLVLHSLAPESTGDHLDSSDLEVFISKKSLVTHHDKHLDVTTELVDKCRRNPELAARGPAYLLYLLLDSMTDVYLPYLDSLDSRLDRIEEAVLEHPKPPTLQEIYAMKRDVIHLRRIATPQLEVLRRLGRAEFPILPLESAVYFRDIYDHIFRVTQTADSYRDLLTGALESYLSALSNEMNQVMKVLTVFASILLPLTFLVGVWGMNFRFMPELGWKYGYAFAWGVMIAAAMGLAWFFHRRRWW